MKKLALVIAVLALGTLASAQSFGFASTGGGLYCNYEQFSYNSGGLVAGTDNLTTACSASANATIAGFTATAHGSGLQAHGSGVVYGDSIYAVFSGDPYAMWGVFSKLKCNKQNHFGQYTGPLGWEGNAAFSGFELGTNQGFLSCTIPGKNGHAPSKGVTVRAKN